MELLARDVATVRVREYIRAEIWALLKEAGLVPQPTAPLYIRKTAFEAGGEVPKRLIVTVEARQ